MLLSYRLPREPSAPRVSLWRRLKRLGVAQISDGLVALPADARTREQLEWAAEEVIEAAGTASVWLARPSTLEQERALAETLAAARAEEYRTLAEMAKAATTASADQARALRRLRTTFREITRRDFFPPPERERASAALKTLAAAVANGQ